MLLTSEILGAFLEKDIQNYFESHFKRYGFDRVKKTVIDGNFIGWKKDKQYKIEIERKSSNFLLHGHDPDKINVILVLINDRDIGCKEKIMQIEQSHFLEWANAFKEDELIAKQKAVNEITFDTEIKETNKELVIKIPAEFYNSFPEKSLVNVVISKFTHQYEKVTKVF